MACFLWDKSAIFLKGDTRNFDPLKGQSPAYLKSNTKLPHHGWISYTEYKSWSHHLENFEGLKGQESVVS